MSTTPAVDGLREALAKLPDSETVEFDFAVPEVLATVEHPREALRALMADRAEPKLAFAAYYALLTRMWRDRDFVEYRKCVEEGAADFGSVPLYASLEAQAKLCSTDPRELRIGVGLAREAMKETPERPSVLHTFADLVATLGEADEAGADELQEGEQAMRLAIKRVPRGRSYAKYHATLARLLGLEGKWYEAQKQIAKAIEEEPWSGAHYALRLGDYQYIRASIALGKRAEELRERQEAAKQELEATRSQVLTLLGLLAAVIAFIVSGVQIAKELQNVRDSTEVMAALTGAILAAFAGFNLLFVPARSKWSLGVLVLGLALLAGVWSVDRWA